MSNRKPTIEEILEGSTRVSQSLSDDKKEMMLSRILESATVKTEVEGEEHIGYTGVVNKEEEMNLFGWGSSFIKQQLNYFQMGTLGVAAAIGVLAVIVSMNATDESSQYTYATLQQSPDYIAFVTEEQQQVEIIDIDDLEITDGDDEQDTTNSENTSEDKSVIAYNTDSSRFANLYSKIGEFGSGWGGMGPTLDWIFTVDRAVDTYSQQQLPEYELYRLSRDEAKKIFSAFSVTTEKIWEGYSTIWNTSVYTNAPKNEFEDTCHLYMTTYPEYSAAPCIDISEHGFIRFEQSKSIAETDGISEAFGYIAALTGLDRNDYSLLSIATNQNEEWVKNRYDEYGISGEISEYYAVSSVPQLDGVQYQRYFWHIALEDGKLIFMSGFVNDPRDSSQQVQIVDSQEAIDRLIEDYERSERDEQKMYTTADAQNNLWPQLNIQDFLETTDVQISIDSIYLEYWNMFTYNNDDSKSYIVVPLYRVIGTEQSTGVTFEAFVDGSTDGKYFSKGYAVVE